MPKMYDTFHSALAKALTRYKVAEHRAHSPEYHRVRNLKICGALIAEGFPVDEVTLLESARDAGFVVIGHGIYSADS